MSRTAGYTAGSVACPVWESEVEAGRVSGTNLYLVWVTPGYHDYNFSIRGDLDETWGMGFSGKLTQALLKMTDPALLAAFGRKAWVATEEGNFDIIRDAARAAGLGDYGAGR